MCVCLVRVVTVCGGLFCQVFPLPHIINPLCVFRFVCLYRETQKSLRTLWLQRGTPFLLKEDVTTSYF